MAPQTEAPHRVHVSVVGLAIERRKALVAGVASAPAFVDAERTRGVPP